MQQLLDGMDGLTNAYATLEDGVSDYVDGADSLAAGTASLSTGADDLAAGTAQLADATGNLDEKLVDAIRDRIEEYLNPSFTPRDFANGTSANLSSVQFIYMTAGIGD